MSFKYQLDIVVSIVTPWKIEIFKLIVTVLVVCLVRLPAVLF